MSGAAGIVVSSPQIHPTCVARYTRDEDDLESLERDVSEESGWKLVHGDVFRPPKHLEVLSALIGTGAVLRITNASGLCDFQTLSRSSQPPARSCPRSSARGAAASIVHHRSDGLRGSSSQA